MERPPSLPLWALGLALLVSCVVSSRQDYRDVVYHPRDYQPRVLQLALGDEEEEHDVEDDEVEYPYGSDFSLRSATMSSEPSKSEDNGAKTSVDSKTFKGWFDSILDPDEPDHSPNNNNNNNNSPYYNPYVNKPQGSQTVTLPDGSVYDLNTGLMIRAPTRPTTPTNTPPSPGYPGYPGYPPSSSQKPPPPMYVINVPIGGSRPSSHHHDTYAPAYPVYIPVPVYLPPRPHKPQRRPKPPKRPNHENHYSHSSFYPQRPSNVQYPFTYAPTYANYAPVSPYPSGYPTNPPEPQSNQYAPGYINYYPTQEPQRFTGPSGAYPISSPFQSQYAPAYPNYSPAPVASYPQAQYASIPPAPLGYPWPPWRPQSFAPYWPPPSRPHRPYVRPPHGAPDRGPHGWYASYQGYRPYGGPGGYQHNTDTGGQYDGYGRPGGYKKPWHGNYHGSYGKPGGFGGVGGPYGWDYDRHRPHHYNHWPKDDDDDDDDDDDVDDDDDDDDEKRRRPYYPNDYHYPHDYKKKQAHQTVAAKKTE